MRERGTRRRGVRAPAVVPAIVVASICTLAFGAGVAQAGGPCVGCSGTYSGEWTATFHKKVFLPLPEKHDTETLKLSWSASLAFQGGENVWTLTSATGTFSIKESGANEEDCETTLSPGPGAVVHGEAFWAATTPGKGLKLEDESGFQTVVAQPPVGWGQPAPLLDPLQSSSSAGGCKAQSTNFTVNGPWAKGLSGPECHFEQATGQDWIAFPRGATTTVTDSCTDPAGTDGPDTWEGISLNAKITLTAPGSGPGGPPSGGKPGNGVFGPFMSAAKQDARDDLRQVAIPNATRYCLPYASGLLLAGSGVVVLGAGGAGPGIIVATGALTAAATQPWCLATLTRIQKDMKTYRDPPLASIRVLARPRPATVASLPSCGRYRGRVRSFCAALRPAYGRLDSSAATVAADTAAVEETVSRESAAGKAGNSSAAAAQDAHLGGLLGTLRADRAKEASAGRAVAAALKAGHVKFRISRAQSSKLIAGVLGQLAKRGLGKSALAPVAGNGLTPKAADLRADLPRI